MTSCCAGQKNPNRLLLDKNQLTQGEQAHANALSGTITDKLTSLLKDK